MQGKGVTRIDAGLANHTGARCVDGVDYLWDDSQGFDHVKIKISLNLTAFYGFAWFLTKPRIIDLTCFQDTKPEDYTDLFEHIWQPYEAPFRSALARKDVEEVHQLWCRVAEGFLITASCCKAQDHIEPPRGTCMPLVWRPTIRDPKESDDKALIVIPGEHAKIVAKCGDLLSRFRRWKNPYSGNDADILTIAPSTVEK